MTHDPNEKAEAYLEPRVSDIRGLMVEMICEHGVGHHRGTHGCDGCCGKPENAQLMEQTTEDEA